MMKLKYLFDNRPLAEMILSNWEFNPERMDLLDEYRISANAIYPFAMNGKICFLRFTPVGESCERKIEAELEFLRYLRQHRYPTVETVLSKKGKELQTVDTPWGAYYAVVFEGVPGERVDRSAINDEVILGLGRTLGRLHELSRNYRNPQYCRTGWREQLQWMNDILEGFPYEVEAREEAKRLEEFLGRLPENRDNFGLIHYDYEPDNLFYDQTSQTFYPIDYDDAVHHWYVMDIEQAIDSMKDNTDLANIGQKQLYELFIEGYRQEMPVEEEMLVHRHIFRRYANLYGYVRILRAVDEKWDNEPEWMKNLREHLNGLMQDRRRFFGQPIS